MKDIGQVCLGGVWHVISEPEISDKARELASFLEEVKYLAEVDLEKFEAAIGVLDQIGRFRYVGKIRNVGK